MKRPRMSGMNVAACKFMNHQTLGHIRVSVLESVVVLGLSLCFGRMLLTEALFQGPLASQRIAQDSRLARNRGVRRAPSPDGVTV